MTRFMLSTVLLLAAFLFGWSAFVNASDALVILRVYG